MHLSPAARIAALTASSSLVLAALVAAAPTAQAAVVTGASVEAVVDTDSDATCADPGAGGADQTVPFDADGVARTATASYSGTITKTGTPADTTTVSGSVTSTAQASQANGQLSQVVLTTNYSLSVSSALGASQGCDADVSAGSQTTYQFDLVSPAYVTLTAESRGGVSQTITGMLSGPDPEVAIAYNVGAHSATTTTLLLPAGTSYVTQSVKEDSVGAPSPTNARTSATGSATVTITLQKPGIALGAATGDAGKYLTLAGGRDCAAGTLTGTWSNAAGKGKKSKIKQAVFYVNGAPVATVKKPQKGATTTLSGLDPSKSATVEVRLKLAKKKPKKHHGAKRVEKPGKGGGTASLEQSYLACS